MIIGLSTGCFAGWTPDVYEKISMVRQCKSANGIEIMFTEYVEFMDFDIGKAGDLGVFAWVSIHLPYHGIIYRNGDKLTEALEAKMQTMRERMNARAFVLHTNVMENWIPGSDVFVENPGSLHKFGARFHELEEIKRRLNPNFVLDLAHMYKVDRKMKDIDRIIALFSDRLKLVHISGFRDGDEHSPLYDAENRELITTHLKKLRGKPIILEGCARNRQSPENDVAFVKQVFSQP